MICLPTIVPKFLCILSPPFPVSYTELGGRVCSVAGMKLMGFVVDTTSTLFDSGNVLNVGVEVPV